MVGRVQIPRVSHRDSRGCNDTLKWWGLDEVERFDLEAGVLCEGGVGGGRGCEVDDRHTQSEEIPGFTPVCRKPRARTEETRITGVYSLNGRGGRNGR